MKNFLFLFLISYSVTACIGDDIIMDMVEEQLRIIMMPSTIAAGDTFQFAARFTNNIGRTEEGKVEWSSSDESLLTIDQTGEATAIQAGEVIVTASVPLNNKAALKEMIPVTISSTPSTTTVAEVITGNRIGTIQTTSSYKLEGDFTLKEINGNLVIEVADNYEASTALPGLYVYLTNNPNTNTNALEIGAVEIFEGAHSYELTGIGINDYDYLLYYCKPFGVKVGDGEIK